MPPPPPPPAAVVPPTPPAVLSAGFSPPPRLGRLTVLRIRSSSGNAPVGGYAVNLGEGGGRLGAAACSLLPPLADDPLNPFLAGVPGTFGVSYTFRKSGRHTVTVTVFNGLCSDERQTTSTIGVSVGGANSGPGQAASAAALRPAGGLIAGTAQAAACGDDLTVPDDATAAVVAAAATCLVNGERADAGLPALAVDTRLLTSATAHTRAMIDGRFFLHQGPAEPDLGARGASAGYRAGMGENIGYGVGALSTASAMVDAWMNSPPHRANILDPRFRGIGMVVVANAPTGASTPGATYTTNFGTEVPTSAPPPAATGPKPTVKATFSPTAFRAAASGPSESPAGPGARISYTLSRASNVVFTVQRRLAGRRAGKRCVAPRPSNRRARACARTRRLGAFRVQGTAGLNRLRFSGRINGRRLAPGAYQLVVVASDAAGKASSPKTLRFRILRGR